MDVQIEPSWKQRLAREFEQPYFVNLTNFVRKEYSSGTCYPPGRLIFNAFNQCSFDDVKVVIIGQDPYHGEGQAHGLCFSVKEGIEPPPSLKNIFKEMESDLSLKQPQHFGELTKWAKQGVLMLNTVLTVRAATPNSHKGKGWENFTDRVISEINKKQTPVVFLLWGNHAIQKAKLINNPIHTKLTTVHPSPLSAYNGFFGCRHFSKTNEILKKSNQQPIDWQL